MKKVYLTWLLPLMTLSAHAVNFNGSYENDANTMFIEGKKLSIAEGNACEHEGILRYSPMSRLNNHKIKIELG